MKKILCLVLTAIFTLAVCGCSSGVEVKDQDAPKTVQATPENERVPIKVVKSGYSIEDNEYIHYGVILENENIGWAAQNFQLLLTAKDSDGNVIGTSTDYITLLCSNGKIGVAGFASFNNPATIEFSVIDSKNIWIEDTLQQSEMDSVLHVDSATVTKNDYGMITVAGEVSNDTDADFNAPQLSAIFFDADGNIIAGYGTYLDVLPAQSTMPYSIDAYSSVPDYASVEVYIEAGYVTD